MMGKVLILPVITKLDISPERVLESAHDQLDTAVIVGWDKSGEFYFASSVADGADVLWLLETAKLELLNGSITRHESEQE